MMESPRSQPGTQPRNWLTVTLKILLTVALLYGSLEASSRGIAYLYFLDGSSESLEKATDWSPTNPEYFAARARYLQVQSVDTPVSEIVGLLEHAASLAETDSAIWAELGGAYEWNGQEEDAMRAYSKAVELFPNSPKLNWKVGNFFIRNGRTEEALQSLQRVVRGDPKLRALTFDLAWRATPDPDMILNVLVPREVDTLFSYLDYLTHSHRYDEARKVWKALLDLGEPFRARPALRYVNRLLRARLTDQAVGVWDDLYFAHPLFKKRKPASELNLVENGDFDDPLFGYGFDWLFQPQKAAAIHVDRFSYYSGTRALRITFRGNENVHFGHVMKFVPVQPNTRYTFTAYMKTNDITTDKGPHFVLEDAADPEALSFRTENLLGSTGWRPQTLKFQTGPETRLIRLRIVRNPSQRIDNQIAGRVWIDRVMLRADP